MASTQIKFFKRIVIALIGFSFLVSCGNTSEEIVTITTPFGDMVLVLYDETPLHKENFLKLAKSGDYDGTIFHRVIENFMIQGGDLNTREGKEKTENYTIEAEIVEGIYHKKGALAAARMGDNVNPTKRSSGSQFYIVQGAKYTESELAEYIENRNQGAIMGMFNAMLGMDKYRFLRDSVVSLQETNDIEGLLALAKSYIPVMETELRPINLRYVNQDQIDIYTTVGGSPHLDRDYTVFGEVISGFEVIDQIAAVPTGQADRPLDEIKLSMKVEKMSRRKIEKQFGYLFPKSKT